MTELVGMKKNQEKIDGSIGELRAVVERAAAVERGRLRGNAGWTAAAAGSRSKATTSDDRDFGGFHECTRHFNAFKNDFGNSQSTCESRSSNPELHAIRRYT